MSYNLDNLTPENIQAMFSHVAFAKGKSDYAPWLAAWLQSKVLDDLAEGEAIGTSELADMIKETASVEISRSGLGKALQAMREAGLLAGCWDYHPTRRYMGRPVIVWTAPGASAPRPVAPGPKPALPALPGAKD